MNLFGLVLFRGGGEMHGHSHGDEKGSHSHGHSHGGSHGHSHGISDSTPLNVRAALIHVFGDLLQVSFKD